MPSSSLSPPTPPPTTPPKPALTVASPQRWTTPPMLVSTSSKSTSTPVSLTPPPTPRRVADVRGWTAPADGEVDVEIAAVSAFEAATAAAIKRSPSSSSSPVHESYPRPSPPASAVASPPAHYRPTSHASTSADRRAARNRERDPAWVPRPPNAFIIFRAEFSRQFSQQGGGQAATAEKTISKRAAEAWRGLAPQRRGEFKARAEDARITHARLHPNYRYRPRKRAAGRERKDAPSRRECVESFVRSREGSSEHDQHDSGSEHSADGAASSPEHDMDEEELLQPRRSSSLPGRPEMPDAYYALSLPLASASTPDVRYAAVAAGHSASPVTDSSYSPFTPVDYFMPELFYTTEDNGGSGQGQYSLQNGYWGQSSSSPTSSWEQLKADDTNSSVYSTPPSSSHSFSSDFSAGAEPLLERRIRASSMSTAPLSPLSPLSVVTSSLAQWNAEPTIAHEPAGYAYAAPVELSLTPTRARAQTLTTHWDNSPAQNALPLQDVVADLERTPRGAVFPQNVHAFVDPSMFDGADAGMFGADYESYAAGLDDLGIASSMAFSASLSVSPEVLNFDDFFNIGL